MIKNTETWMNGLRRKSTRVPFQGLAFGFCAVLINIYCLISGALTSIVLM